MILPQERKLLIEQVDQTLQFKSDAEKEADAALTQLEDFITEQERLVNIWSFFLMAVSSAWFSVL